MGPAGRSHSPPSPYGELAAGTLLPGVPKGDLQFSWPLTAVTEVFFALCHADLGVNLGLCGPSWDFVGPSPSLTPFLEGADRRDERPVDVSCLSLSFPICTARALDPMTLWSQVQGWPKCFCMGGGRGGGRAEGYVWSRADVATWW